MRHSQPLQFQKTDGNGIKNIDLQSIDRHQSTSLTAPIRSSVCQRTEFPKRTMISGRRIFFLPSPSPLSFFRPSSYRKGYYFYSPQSSIVIKSKMAATTILRTRTRFRPPKIRLHCRLDKGICPYRPTCWWVAGNRESGPRDGCWLWQY